MATRAPWRSTRSNPPRDASMTIVEHLTELRRRLVISIVAIAAGAVVAWFLYPAILGFLEHPYCQVVPRGTSCKLFVTDPLEPFLLRLKVSGWSGAFLASPIVLWQVWRFITPGLNPNEKRYAIPFIVSSILLFSFGGAVALLTFPKALQFLITVGGTSLQAILNPIKYIRLIILMIVAFGLAFELPIVLIFLELAHVVSSATLGRYRRHAIVGVFVVAAVITPTTDPYTMVAMAVPMCVFYELSILVGKLLKR